MMTYLCPKCKNIMITISTASIPPITTYQCMSCGYVSKPVTNDLNYMTLPPWLQQDEESENES